MTAQISDMFILRGTEYYISGISEGELFDVKSLGIEPICACTACWRGYQMVAGVNSEKKLIIETLNVGLADPSDNYKPIIGPVLNGVKPTGPKDKFDWFNNHYNSLGFQIGYTGGMLITQDFIEDLYVHMGFHPAWKFKVVFELVFQDGLLISEINKSKQMAEIRKNAVSKAKSTGVTPRSDKEIEQWIARAFDRRY